MLHNQLNAYHRSQKLSMPPREGEAMAFTKAANLLSAVAREDVDPAAYRAALIYNQKLWTLVQDAMFTENKRLPDDLKADLISLSIYVDKQTVAAMARRDPARATALSEIDRRIASGLLAKPDALAA
jgi:flagellar protein FlaF